MRWGYFAALAAVTIVPSVEAADFKGKTMTVITSTGAGGTYDVSARAIARFMPKYLNGRPTMVVQNMPGGGNVLATNHMYNIAAKDGTSIATLHNAMPLHQVLDGKGVRFDAAKFNWLGSLGPENSAVVSWHTSGVTKFEQLREREVVLGGTGAGSGIVIFPKVMNATLGTKFKIVIGYKTSDEINIAMERGEVQARTTGLASVFSQNTDWITDKKANFLAQIGPRRDRRLPDVPLWTEFATSDEQREVLNLVAAPTSLGKPFTAPPDVPADIMSDLRKAFSATLADKEFLAEMEKLSIEIDPMTAEEVTELVRATVNTPARSIAQAKAFME
jgi:tripartite-type tricarboxylate transporter receptor subunit TctC